MSKMTGYAGTIRFKSTENKTGIDKSYFQNLLKRFPTAFARSQFIDKPPLSIAGHFESISHENLPLFFFGDIFNRTDISSLLNASPLTFPDNAALVHALIQSKGLEEVKKINGQFIIIYFDKRQQKIFIINDHLGIEQMFYYQNKNIFLFAREIKLLLAHPECPKEIDWETSLKQPLGFPGLNSFRSYKTWFKDISLLPGATIVEIDLPTGNTRQRKYWNGFYPSNHDLEKDNRTAAKVMEEYLSLLDDAVRIRTSDDSTAYSLLSGGLDSSVICALAAKHKPLETFSIITQMTCLEDTTSICNRLAKDIGFKNSQFLIPFHEMAFDRNLWKQRIWRAESPVDHPDSLTKTMLHYSIQKKYPHIKHLLSGTGSDQFNGGLARWVASDSETKEESWEIFFNEIVDSENRKLVNRDDDGLWNMRKFIHRDFLSSVSDQKIEDNSWMFYVTSALHDVQYGLLWDETRASCSHGHSTRFPFMDFRFAEFISAIPPHLQKELFYDKPILREPAKTFLPDYVIRKPKAPYFFPEYDLSLRLFNFLTGTDELIVEAFGDLDKPHPVIDIPSLSKGIHRFRNNPENIEWVYLLRIINTGLLEKLSEKDENDMNYEFSLEEPVEIDFAVASETNVFLKKRLKIRDSEEQLNYSLQFENECSLLFDKLKNKYFLARKNNVAYEIDDESVDWKNFLVQIDNVKSTNQILNEQNIKFETIEEFFRLSLKEQILITKENLD